MVATVHSGGCGLAKAKLIAEGARFTVGDEGRIFRPIEGDTGDKAATLFTRPSAHGVYVALFDYDAIELRGD
jgi:hypothetical protein